MQRDIGATAGRRIVPDRTAHRSGPRAAVAIAGMRACALALTAARLRSLLASLAEISGLRQLGLGAQGQGPCCTRVKSLVMCRLSFLVKPPPEEGEGSMRAKTCSKRAARLEKVVDAARLAPLCLYARLRATLHVRETAYVTTTAGNAATASETLGQAATDVDTDTAPLRKSSAWLQLAAVAQGCRALRVLDISGNVLGDDGAVAIASVLQGEAVEGGGRRGRKGSRRQSSNSNRARGSSRGEGGKGAAGSCFLSEDGGEVGAALAEGASSTIFAKLELLDLQVCGSLQKWIQVGGEREEEGGGWVGAHALLRAWNMRAGGSIRAGVRASLCLRACVDRCYEHVCRSLLCYHRMHGARTSTLLCISTIGERKKSVSGGWVVAICVCIGATWH